MANILLKIDMITREALRVAHEQLSFISTIDLSYDDFYSRSGAKIGDSLRIRQPNQYVRRKGSRVMDVQDQNETSVTLTVATQDGVDMKFNSAELSLDIDDFSKRYIEPAVKVLVAGVEGDTIEKLTKLVYQETGTAGTIVGASADITAITAARTKLNQQLAPKGGDRTAMFDSVTMGSVVNGIQALFHDGMQIKESFKEGLIARNAMADWYENEKMYNHTSGTDHTTVTINDTSLASGDTGFTTAGANVTVGSVFTIAGVLDIHPETKTAYTHNKQFTILTVSGNDWTFSPAIVSDTTDPKQNIDALPSNSDAITVFAAANDVNMKNLMYHKEAFAFVTADLPRMDDAHKSHTREQDGLSMRVWQGSDIRNDELLMRIDILYGSQALRPEWAVRISN